MSALAVLRSRPAGDGRKEPNANPTLPKPTGRLKFTLNPFAMLFRLLGPKLCKRLAGVVCLAVLVLLLYYVIPVFIGNLPFAAIKG